MSAAELGVVRAVEEVQEGLYNLELVTAPRVAQGSAPGRYAMVSIGEDTDPFLPRPLWVRRTGDSLVGLLVQVAGRGTEWLARRRPRDRVRFYGPLGKPLQLPPRTQRLLLAGDTCGLNCLLALADHALDGGAEVALVLPAQDTRLSTRLLPPDVEVLPGLDSDALQWADALYCVGSPGVVLGAMGTLRDSRSRIPAYGLPHAPIACGVGACYGCVVETRKGARLSCVDGPAFDLRELVWT
ncbi:MAG: hypothetical protein M3Q29_01690 [Chloroflexota bacterium]|nr:hypothetical protein [Chloroflexota bacterium]